MRSSPEVNFNAPAVQPIRLTTEMKIHITPFDQREYRRLIEARGETIQRVVSTLKTSMNLTTAVDAGCGVGFFSRTLTECGLDTCGFDARTENVEESRRRFPEIAFGQGDVEDEGISHIGRFDLVLCFGLLYHLESPLRAIRNLHSMTRK